METAHCAWWNKNHERQQVCPHISTAFPMWSLFPVVLFFFMVLLKLVSSKTHLFAKTSRPVF